MVYIKFALVCCQILVLATSVNAMDFDLMNVANRNDNSKDDKNLFNIYNDKWNSHYEQHNIIDILDLNKDEYAESIENIRKIGLSSVQIYVNNEMHNTYVWRPNPEDKPVTMIATNMCKGENLLDYLMRQEVENLNYILLENLMMWLPIGGTEYTTDELLNWLVNQIEKKLASIQKGEIFEKIMTKLHESAEDVKTYVEAGMLDEFMISFTDYQEDEANFEDGHSDNGYEDAESQNSFEQDIQNAIDEAKNEMIDINTEEGEKIATNLITNIYKLAEIYELAAIVASEFNETGDLVKTYTYELDDKGELAKIYELLETGESLEVDKSDKIYELAAEKEKSLCFSSENEAQLLQTAQQAKNALNEFEQKVKGGTTSRELMRELELTVLEYDDEDYPYEKKVAKQDGNIVVPIDLNMSRIWNLLERFEGEITNDWLDVNIKATLLNLKPHLEKYLTKEKYLTNWEQIVEDEEDKEDEDDM